MALIYFVLVSYGITQILVYGSIFNKLRPSKGFFGEMLHCPMCLGFWVGIFVYGVSFYTELFTFELNWTNPWLLGSLSSGTSYALSMLFGDGGINVKRN
tara:strand:- start:3986 stop:4282 length:297 start_codon:yes stop_codon:yes gene_type:complete